MSLKKSNSISLQYNNSMQSLEANKNHMESSEVFRSVYSNYSIENNLISINRAEKWNRKNAGGIPVDYDSSLNTAFIDSSDAHTLLIGATGSKKSRLVVMPTVKILANVGESMIISDPKGEIYQRTGNDLDKNGYELKIINLREPQRGDCWNLLLIPYLKYLAGDIDKSCELLNDTAITLMPLSSNDPYWDYSSRDLFIGLALLLFKKCKESRAPSNAVNMRNLLDIRTNMFYVSITERIKQTSFWIEAEEDSLIKSKLLGIVSCPKDTMSCILSVFDQYLSCFSLNPQMIEMMSNSNIDLSSFATKKTAIFVIMPDEKTTYHKIVTVFIKQVYEYLIDMSYSEFKNNHFPIRINFILDEFSSLPCIGDFPQMISAARSRNIRFLIVVQSKNQLVQRYKEEALTIMSNCTNWMFLFSRELDLLKEISELAGEKNHYHEQLIPMTKLQHLDKNKGECLIFANRLYPYITHLPDIDIFDMGNFKILPLKKRNNYSKNFPTVNELFPEKNFKNNSQIYIQDKNDGHNMFSNENINLDMNELKRRIDARIAELEAEETKSDKGGVKFDEQ
ncbi:MAG: type IV secretory system conjugative DNA transfer family protein [Ruminococcus sp.]|nr:type IV secretory system conjugative DNA transfer family protein [Ruminococcus sp.]